MDVIHSKDEKARGFHGSYKRKSGGIVLAKVCLSDEGKLDGESYPDKWFTDESANLAKY